MSIPSPDKSMELTMQHLAIDFGTTNSAVARQIGDTIEVLALSGLSKPSNHSQPPLIPSLLFVQDGQEPCTIAGHAVIAGALHHTPDQRLFRNFKRGITATPPPSPRLIDGASWRDHDAAQYFVQHLIAALPLPLETINTLVLTAPTTAFEHYSRWLSSTISPLLPDPTNVRLVDESTAAALGYAVTEPGAIVLLLDFGGGTLDLSLVQLPEGESAAGGLLGHLRQHKPPTARVIAKTGYVLGGSDIDHWLFEYVLKHESVAPEDADELRATLFDQCEQAKITLSTSETATLEFMLKGTAHNVTVTRADLEALLDTKGFYAAIRHTVDKVMHIARKQGIYSEDVWYVLMVGGTSLIPSVKATLARYFESTTLRTDKPFTAVVEGALRIASGYRLDDYLMHSYGIRHFDPEANTHAYEELIPMGTAYPTPKPFEIVLRPAHDGQQSVALVIGEVPDDTMHMIAVQATEGETKFVSQTSEESHAILPVNAHDPVIVPLDPPGAVGVDRLKAVFSVDAQRQLHVTVTDLKHRKTLCDNVLIAASADETTQHAAADVAKNVAQTDTLAPVLGGQQTPSRWWQLSSRSLGTLLNTLSPHAISLDAAQAMLSHENYYVRYKAARLLCERGDRPARLLIEDTLANGSIPTRANLARHLHRLTWFSAQPLMRQALNDPEDIVREAAVYALCELRTLDSYTLLTHVLDDASDIMRAAAAWGLRNCQDSAAVPTLASALRAHDPEVRAQTLEALSANNTPEAVPVVKTALNDPEPDVVYHAVLSLLELRAEKSLPDIIALLHTTRGDHRAAALRGLFHASNYLHLQWNHCDKIDVLIDVIAESLTGGNTSVSSAAVWALAGLRNDRAQHIIKDTFFTESDTTLKAHILRVSVALMLSETLVSTLLNHALTGNDTDLQIMAAAIKDAQASGHYALHDSAAQASKPLSRIELVGRR